MKRKELPVGLQTFHTIRKEQGAYYYVDKTDYAYQLARKEGHFFLSRPRRFGKSLFVDTLKNLFEGNKKLFEGLDIYDKWDCALPTVVADRRLGRSAVSKYPVVRLDFTGGDFTKPGKLEAFIVKQLARIEQSEELTSDEEIAPERFADLIEKLYEAKGQRVVILVDEYDEPDLSTKVAGRRRQAATGSADALETPEMEDVARENRNTLRAFYGIIKRCDKYIRFSFLTGVTKFARAGIFSGINNLRDITLEPEFSSICGYTDHDLDTVFAPELELIHPKFGKFDREEIKECALPTDVTGRQSGTDARSGRRQQAPIQDDTGATGRAEATTGAAMRMYIIRSTSCSCFASASSVHGGTIPALPPS